jgi:hypothetical protein
MHRLRLSTCHPTLGGMGRSEGDGPRVATACALRDAAVPAVGEITHPGGCVSVWGGLL